MEIRVTRHGRHVAVVTVDHQPRLNASMNQSIVTYTVVVDTDNSDGKLYPYLTADVHFQVETHKDVLLVPNAALRWRPSPEWLAAAGLDASQALLLNAADDDRSGRGTVWILENDKPQPVAVQQRIWQGARSAGCAREPLASSAPGAGVQTSRSCS